MADKGIIERNWEGLKQYLANTQLPDKHPDHVSLLPGALGATLGAGTSALMTASDPNETPVTRAKRTLRNALLGGVLGGVGTQALVKGTKDVADILAPGPKKSKPGAGSSILARALYGVGGSQLGRAFNWRGGGHTGKKIDSFISLAGNKGLGSVELIQNPASPAANAKVPLGRPDVVASGAAATREAQGDYIRRLYKTLRSTPELKGSFGTVNQQGNTLDTLVAHLQRAKGATPKAKAMTKAQLENFLKAQGIPAGTGLWNKLKSLGMRADQSFNSWSPHSLSRTGRVLGRTGTYGGAVAGVAAPWIVEAIAGKGEPSDHGALSILPRTPRNELPDATPPSLWDKLIAPR